MTLSAIIPYGYSALLTLGGIIGFKKGSKASLIASSIVAAINAGSAYAYQSSNQEQKWALYGQLLAASLMAYLGGKKFLTKGTPIMGVIGVASFFYFVHFFI